MGALRTWVLAPTVWTKAVCKPMQLTHQHSLKSGGWPGFEPGSLTFMACALTSKLPTKLVAMSACLLTDGSKHFYQGLHFTCRYNTQLKFQQLLCTWVALGTTYMGTGSSRQVHFSNRGAVEP